MSRSRCWALCIGMNNYEETRILRPLKGCINDAQDVGALLGSHGFDVKILRNASGEEAHDEVGSLIERCGTADRVVVMLSGHGAQYENDSYLFPVDFGTRKRSGVVRDTQRDALAIHRDIVTRLQGKNKNGLNVIITDMCRSSTRFRGQPSTKGGEERIAVRREDQPTGTLVAYACEQGHTSVDTGKNGVYTSVLLKHLAKQIDISKLFRVVTTEVQQKCAGMTNPMRPWFNANLLGGEEDIVLVTGGGATTQSLTVAVPNTVLGVAGTTTHSTTHHAPSGGGGAAATAPSGGGGAVATAPSGGGGAAAHPVFIPANLTGRLVTRSCVAQFNHGGKVEGLTLLEGGQLVSGSKLVVSGIKDAYLRLWNPTTGMNVATMVGKGLNITALPGGRFATAGGDKAEVWDASSHTRVCEYTRENDYICCVVPLPGNLVASGSFDNIVCIWNATSGAHVATLKGHNHVLCALALLPDGRLASGSNDNTVRLWDISKRSCTRVLQHKTSVYAIAVLEGGILASGCDDNKVYLWDITMNANSSSAVPVARLEGHTHQVIGLAALRRGLLASASLDKTVRVWNVAAQRCVALLEGHTSFVFALAALPDGRLASGSYDMMIRVWDVSDLSDAPLTSSAATGRACPTCHLPTVPSTLSLCLFCKHLVETPLPSPPSTSISAGGPTAPAPPLFDLSALAPPLFDLSALKNK